MEILITDSLLYIKETIIIKATGDIYKEVLLHRTRTGEITQCFQMTLCFKRDLILASKTELETTSMCAYSATKVEDTIDL